MEKQVEKEVRKLSKHIENHYELMRVQPGEVIIDGVAYDFRKITKEVADELYATEKGKKYLKKIEAKAEAKAAAKS